MVEKRETDYIIFLFSTTNLVQTDRSDSRAKKKFIKKKEKKSCNVKENIKEYMCLIMLLSF